MSTSQEPYPTTDTPPPILTLPHNISIRPYHAPTDCAPLSLHANNLAVWNNLRNRMPHPYTPTDSLNWITHANSTLAPSGPWDSSTASATGPPLPTHYAICIADTAVGSIGLDFGSPDDVYARTAELGYWLGEAHWGQGIMNAAVPAFVAWAWETFGVLVRINAETDAGNVGSGRVLERAGLRVEGRREKGCVKNGVLRDVVLWGMVRPGMQGT